MKQIFQIKISALLLGSALSFSVGAVAALLPLLFLVPLYKKLGNAGMLLPATSLNTLFHLNVTAPMLMYVGMGLIFFMIMLLERRIPQMKAEIEAGTSPGVLKAKANA